MKSPTYMILCRRARCHSRRHRLRFRCLPLACRLRQPKGEARWERISRRRARGKNKRNNITDSPPAVPLSAADDSASAAYLLLAVFVSVSLRVRREANNYMRDDIENKQTISNDTDVPLPRPRRRRGPTSAAAAYLSFVGKRQED